LAMRDFILNSSSSSKFVRIIERPHTRNSEHFPICEGQQEQDESVTVKVAT
jgi:hypothetical protein